MKTKVWLNLDPQKVDVNYLYKKFEEMGCDFEAEAIPDNDPELLVKKGKSKIYSKIWNRSRLCRFKSCRKKWDSCC